MLRPSHPVHFHIAPIAVLANCRVTVHYGMNMVYMFAPVNRSVLVVSVHTVGKAISFHYAFGLSDLILHYSYEMTCGLQEGS